MDGRGHVLDRNVLGRHIETGETKQLACPFGPRRLAGIDDVVDAPKAAAARPAPGAHQPDDRPRQVRGVGGAAELVGHELEGRRLRGAPSEPRPGSSAGSRRPAGRIARQSARLPGLGSALSRALPGESAAAANSSPVAQKAARAACSPASFDCAVRVERVRDVGRPIGNAVGAEAVEDLVGRDHDERRPVLTQASAISPTAVPLRRRARSAGVRSRRRPSRPRCG